MDADKRRFSIKSPADLQKIQGYRCNVDPKSEPLKKILHGYFVKPEVQCGLSVCHQWHNEGYLVELENGGITNVGHICGAQFGDKFDVERNRYTDFILRPQALQVVRDGKKRLESLQVQIGSISDAATRLSTRKTEFRKRFPGLSKELDRRASNGSPIVTESIERSSGEIEDLLAANPHQNRETLRFRDVEKGRITGLQLFSINIQERITSELVSKSRDLATIDVDLQKTEVLMRWEGWLNSFDEHLAEAIDFIAKAENFFSEANYQLIALLPSQPKESLLLKHLKTASLDNVATGYELQGAMKKLNRSERRKLKFSTLS